jgi:hypothetical protein
MNKKWNSNLGTNCPFCKPGQCLDPWRSGQCTLNKPLWMVIPLEGVHLDCPVHPEGHHVFGSAVMWGTPDYDSSRNRTVEFDSTRRWRTTGDII